MNIISKVFVGDLFNHKGARVKQFVFSAKDFAQAKERANKRIGGFLVAKQGMTFHQHTMWHNNHADGHKSKYVFVMSKPFANENYKMWKFELRQTATKPPGGAN